MKTTNVLNNPGKNTCDLCNQDTIDSDSPANIVATETQALSLDGAYAISTGPAGHETTIEQKFGSSEIFKYLFFLTAQVFKLVICNNQLIVNN